MSTPFGLYKYKRLPMGITNSPYFFQSVMHPLFTDLPDIEYFINDIGIFSLTSFSDHLQQLHQVLLRLEKNGSTVPPPLNCEWTASSTECFGFLLTPQGIKTLQHKVKAITFITQPSSSKHARSFVSLVNYCKNMWRCRALFWLHLLMFAL